MEEAEKNKVCPKCGSIVNDDSKFCANCGSVISEDNKIICPKCNKENKVEAKFCTGCGAQLQSNSQVSEKEKEKEQEKIPWKLDGKPISITFLICAVLGTYLLMSPGALKTIFHMYDGNFFGVISCIIGVITLLVPGKEKFNFENDLKKLKSLNLTKTAVGAIFVIAGILIFMGIGSEEITETFFIFGLILMCAVILLIGLVLGKNVEKANSIAQVSSILTSIIGFLSAVVLNNIGKEKNSSLESQFDSFWNSGTVNPGDSYIEGAKFLAIVAAVFLLLFFILRTSKSKNSIVLSMITIMATVLFLVIGLIAVAPALLA